MSEKEAFHELCAYTLGLGDLAFIHQHVVDAFAAQNADESTKPIKITFALVGLYLHAEKNYTGRQVQRAHQFLARRKRDWPSFTLPHARGSITPTSIMAFPAGLGRAQAIDRWSDCVWAAFRDSHQVVAELWRENGPG